MGGRSTISNKLGEDLEMGKALGEMGATQNRNGMLRRYDTHLLKAPAHPTVADGADGIKGISLT